MEQEFRVFTLCKFFSDITISLLENEIKIVYLYVVFEQQTYRKRLAFYSLSESGQFACRKAHKYNGNKGYRLHWLFMGFSLAIAESVSRESYPLYGSPEPAQIRCQVGPRFLFYNSCEGQQDKINNTMFISTFLVSAMMMVNAPVCETIAPAESTAVVMTQDVAVRKNAHLKCNAAGAELYLYTNGSFKLISRDEALKGSYTIEDGVNLVLNASGYRTTYGKIYFRGLEVSKVVLGDRTYFPA